MADSIKSPKLGQIGQLPTGWRKKTPEEIAASTATDSGPLIGGAGSSALGSFTGAITSGLAGTLAAPFKAFDEGMVGLSNLINDTNIELTPETASPIGKLGYGIESVAADIAAPDPARAEDFATKLGSGLGSTIGFALPFAAAGKASKLAQTAMSAGLGAAATGVEQVDDYKNAVKQSGLDYEGSDAAASFFYGLLPGTLEGVPLARAFGRLDSIAKGGLQAAVKNTAKGTVEEALQEGLQNIGNNFIANGIVKYDPDRNMFFDTPEAAAVGGGVGFIMNSAMSALGLRQRGKFQAMSENVSKADQEQRIEDVKAQGRINPVTQQEIGTADIAKANTQIMRLESFMEQNPQSAEGMQKRIDAIKKQLTDKYIKPKKGADGKAVEIDEVAKQEAQDVIDRMRAEEITPEEITIQGPVAEAEPFPTKKGIRVGEIKNKKDVEKYFKQLRGEEITIDQVPTEELPPVDLINLQEMDAAIEEITLDTTPAEPPTTFLKDKPGNYALADALGKLQLRNRTDEAYAARKQAEEAEAYRQREVQLGEKKEEGVQEAAVEPTIAREAEQAQEEISATQTQASIEELKKLTKRQAYPGPESDLEGKEVTDPFKRQAGFGDTLPPMVEQEFKDGLPKYLERQPNEAIPARNGMPDSYVPEEKPKMPKVSKKPMSGIMHTLRNEEDLGSVLDTGLKEGTNVGGRNSQAVGGGITLEYDAADLEVSEKGYNPGEGVVSKQQKAKPKRILVDTSDLALTKGTEGTSTGAGLLKEMEDMLDAGVDMDTFYGDVGGLTMIYERGMYTAAERTQELKNFENKYGKDVTDFFKENGEDLAYAMNNPEGVQGQTEEEYLQTIVDMSGGVPVYTYQVDEDGKPVNIKEVKGASKDQETAAVHGDVRQQEGAGETRTEVPVKKGSERVQAPQEVAVEPVPEGVHSLINGDVTAANGKLFKTEASAKAARTRKGMKDSHMVLAMYINGENGFILRAYKGGLEQRNAIEQNIAEEQTAPSRVFKNGEPTPDTDLVVEDAPEAIIIDQEVVDYVLTLSERMKKDPRPERYAQELIKGFGSVKAFMSLRASILSGEVVGGDPNAVIMTPVGEVENTKVTQPDPPTPVKVKAPLVESKVFAEETSQLDTELNDLDVQIMKLEEDLTYAEDPDKIMKRLENLQIKRENLEKKKKKAVSNETKAKKAEEKLTQEFTKDEIDEFVNLNNDATDLGGYDEDFAVDDVDSTGATEADIQMAQTAVDKFYASLDEKFKGAVDIIVASKPSDIPAEYKTIAKMYSTGIKQLGYQGVIYRNLDRRHNAKRNLVVIFAKPGRSFHSYEATIFHEVVGHYGLRQLWGKHWGTEMSKLLANPEIASRAYAMRTRWDNIDLNPASSKDTMWINDKYDYVSYARMPSYQKFKPGGKRPQVRVSIAGMQQLMDEYLAEIAGDFAGHKNFQPVDKLEQGIIARMIKAIRHLLRKSGFGKYSSDVADKHLIQLMQASYTNLTRVAAYKEGNMTLAAMEANASMEAVIKEGSSLGLFSEEDARAVIRSIDAREGRLDNSNWQRNIESLSDRIRRSWIGKNFSSTGWLPHPSKLNAVENLAKGKMEKATRDARIWFQKTKDLNDGDKQAIFQYFTTKDADPLLLPEKIRKMAVSAKLNIEELGEQLVQLGMLSRKTYEANKGSYLPIRYWKYLESYYATGKQLSFRNYLKAREDLSTEEKQALGQVQDPSFLVSETIAVLGRDVALQTMFKNMTTMNRVGNLGWFIETPRWIDVGGRKMSMADLEANIERLNEQLAMGTGVNPLYINEKGVEEIQRQIGELEEAKRSAEVQAFNEGIDNAIRAAAGPNVEITEEMRRQYRGQFKQFKDRRLGHLNYKWARKEIYEEITEGNQMYNREAVDFMSKHFGAGGTADIANQYWKAGKVVMNPPSWVRNGIGNWILLDIGTDTNNFTLAKYMGEELSSLAKGQMSKYAQWAHDYGLYNTTYSAAELSLIQSQAMDAFKGQTINIGDMKNPAKKMWWMFHSGFHRYLEWSTNFYGGMEGLFKTIALKDHIQRYEKMSGKKIESLSQAEREAVIRSGVELANKNIFDYSKVPGWMRTMRRMPFIGAPFLTYTFKAIPQSIESLARRPQKFIKYAMFPTVMAQMFLSANDLDDDDMAEIQRKMPQWIKEKSSVFLLPWKDNNGKWQAMDFGYYVPWAPLHDMMLMAQNTFDPNNAAMSILQTGGNALYNLGFLGGPMPQLISGFLSNKDPFTGREIVRTAGTSFDKANDLMTYMVDLWMPPFITSKGVLGRTLDNMGVEPTLLNSGREFSALGVDRETAMQTALRGIGMNVYGIDEREAAAQSLKRHQLEMRKLKTARTQIIKDRNLSPEQKAGKLREMNEQIKLLNEKRREEISGE